MKQAILHGRLMDIARLWVANIERTVRPMPIRMRNEIPMEQKDMVHEAQREFLNIRFISLADNKFRPCLQKIFDARDVFKRALKFNHV